MKRYLVLAALASPLLASCAHPLEQMVEERRQQRMEAACADQPINAGVEDGVGRSAAPSAMRLTLSDRPMPVP
jgi:hypothetical protein